MSVMLLGTCPAADEDYSGVAWVGSDSGKRLANLVGLDSDRELEEHFICENVFEVTTVFANRAETRDAARKALTYWMPTVVVACSSVARLGVVECTDLDAPASEVPWMTWHTVTLERTDWTFKFAAIPHPSGRTRFWNDRNNVARAKEFFTALRLTMSEGAA